MGGCPFLLHSLQMLQALCTCSPPKQLQLLFHSATATATTAPACAAVQQRAAAVDACVFVPPARALAHDLALRRHFPEALQILHGELACIRNILCRRIGGKNWRVHFDAEELWSLAREFVALQCRLGAVLEGCGRYAEAGAAYDAAFHTFRNHAAASALAVLSHDAHEHAAAQALLSWRLQLQLHTLHSFAQHCTALLLLLRAFTSSPALHPSHRLPPPLLPPPARALHLLRQLWHSSSSRGGRSDAHQCVPAKHRARALSLSSSAAAAATRLASTLRWPAAAVIMRRCFSCRGAHALLTACAQPPEYACA